MSGLKLGLIAGGGQVPVEIARYLISSGREYSVIRLDGLADPELKGHPGHDVALGDFAELFSCLTKDRCQAVCMVGYVKRPDFDSLKRDKGGATHLPSIRAAGRGGDDGLLRQVASIFEAQGFVIEGAHQANPNLLLGAGLLCGPMPSSEAMEDAHEAFRIAKAIGGLDIGQAAIVAGKITLGVEAQEGTDALIRRIQTLSKVLTGTQVEKKGVLAKVAKPIQDLRLDMPTIGLSTIDLAYEAGLCGIVGQADALLIVDKPRLIAHAESLGLFIYGIDA
jgi:UDP-2,3-diacylglucosamine hydrolase